MVTTSATSEDLCLSVARKYGVPVEVITAFHEGLAVTRSCSGALDFAQQATCDLPYWNNEADNPPTGLFNLVRDTNTSWPWASPPG